MKQRMVKTKAKCSLACIETFSLRAITPTEVMFFSS
ncbi:hypothetical protein RUE5091_04480 [Ruegeria denitrificans]|uniref:Uncharacterized protein n=1 Tax=Ruegeria denitrificans TaxID=1715692 RepID=A0A0N7MB12_9RHOB|nr:hypothetical protein RUE5091_04480 [Ruegeria denitrificans]